MSAERIQALAGFFNGFARADVDRLGQWYHPEARFKDPFNEVQGLAAIAQVYRHMFEQVEDPRFAVRSAMASGDEGWMAWDFSFHSRGRVETLRGATHFRFAPDGLILVHRDYWDTSEELYEKVPLLGSLMRAIKRRLKAPQH